ncbi:MAG: energy transducer TonB, partial [Flavobacteriaceae bacterium]
HIEVDALGKVILASLNTNSSTTTNVCLIENAIHYANKARFTKDENKPSQMGSITYIFPGQE